MYITSSQRALVCWLSSTPNTSSIEIGGLAVLYAAAGTIHVYWTLATYTRDAIYSSPLSRPYDFELLHSANFVATYKGGGINGANTGAALNRLGFTDVATGGIRSSRIFNSTTSMYSY